MCSSGTNYKGDFCFLCWFWLFLWEKGFILCFEVFWETGLSVTCLAVLSQKLALLETLQY